MKKDIGQLWDEKFSRDGYFYGFEPNAFIASKLDLLKDKKDILCLGEGEGRNAVFLASKGFNVTALDASAIAMAKALKFANDKGLGFNVQLVDLEYWKPTCRYDSIVSSYLHLEDPLRTKAFKQAIQTLKTDGYFIAEFFSINQIPRDSGGPKKPELLYTLDSLKSIFSISTCRIVYLEEVETFLDEGKGHQGDALVIRVIVQKV